MRLIRSSYDRDVWSVTDVLSGRDTFIIFPTGYGKSPFYRGSLMNFGAATKQALFVSFAAFQLNTDHVRAYISFATLMLIFVVKVYIQTSDSWI